MVLLTWNLSGISRGQGHYQSRHPALPHTPVLARTVRQRQRMHIHLLHRRCSGGIDHLSPALVQVHQLAPGTMKRKRSWPRLCTNANGIGTLITPHGIDIPHYPIVALHLLRRTPLQRHIRPRRMIILVPLGLGHLTCYPRAPTPPRICVQFRHRRLTNSGLATSVSPPDLIRHYQLLPHLILQRHCGHRLAHLPP